MDSSSSEEKPKGPSTSPTLPTVYPKEDALELYKSKMGLYICDLPPIKVVGLDTSTSTTIDGDTMEKHIAARSISTYPLLADGRRDGDPIADRFTVKLWRNRAWIALADGCNWGSRAFNAAKAAIAACDDFLQDKHDEVQDLVDAGHCLLRAFCEGHQKIYHGKNDIWEAGTTTLFSSYLFQIAPPANHPDIKWVVLAANVGDCKCFIYSKKSKTVVDLTSGEKLFVKDRCDPGGRLGPYLEGGTPDLRNLRLFYTTAHSGDILIAVSDGVYDNLDPEQLGVPPNKVDEKSEYKDWKSVPGDMAEKFKVGFRCDYLLKLIEPLKAKSAKNIAQAIIDHCVSITSKSRDFMEKNPNRAHPPDYAEYPGKMDHTTCVCLVIPDAQDHTSSSGKGSGAATATAAGNGSPPPRKEHKNDKSATEAVSGDANEDDKTAPTGEKKRRKKSSTDKQQQ